MGDMGGGFLYVRHDRIADLRRPIYGLQQLEQITFNGFPRPGPEADEVCSWRHLSGARALFEAQTLAMPPILAGLVSLDLLDRIGVPAIEEHRQPLLARVRSGLEELDLECLTPQDSRSAIIAFALGGRREAISRRLDAAGIRASVFENFLRVAPSFYNGMDDIELLIAAVKAS